MNRSFRAVLPNFLFVLCGLLLLQCQKQEIKGPQGDPGTPGGGGNANITSTNTFVVTSEQWHPDSASHATKATVVFSELTKDIVARATVKVYVLTGSLWRELPFDTGDLYTQYGF